MNPLIYLNTAGCGLVKEKAISVGNYLYKNFSINSSTASEIWRDETFILIKQNIASFLKVDSTEIALIPNFSYAINSIVQSLKGTEKVLLYKKEYPSLTAPFMINKFPIEWINDLDDFYIDLNEIENIFKSKHIEILAISHVQWLTGFKIDLLKLSNLCKKYGVILIVDGTQSLGAVEIDLSTLQVDVFLLSNYKWMNAGFGTGILYINKAFLKRFPPVIGGFNSYINSGTNKTRNISILDYEPGHINMYGFTILDEAIKEKKKIGIKEIENYNKNLTQFFMNKIIDLPITVNGEKTVDNRSSIVFVRDENNLGQFLKEKNVIVTSRFGNLRISFHYYNTTEEINRTIEYLKEWKNKK